MTTKVANEKEDSDKRLFEMCGLPQHFPMKLKNLIRDGGNVDTKQPFGLTPLMNASVKGCPATVRLLITKNASVTETDDRGFTPLHYACQRPPYDTKQAKEIVEILLEHHADVNKKSLTGLTPLMLAVHFPEIVQLLIENKADVEATDQLGHSALLFASSSNATQSIKLLLNHGADLNGANIFGQTALIKAIEYECKHAQNILVENWASIDKRDSNGNTALIIATQVKSIESVKLLLDQNANVDATNDYDQSALMIAAKNNQTDILWVLLNNSPKVDLSDFGGKTALMYACENHSLEALKLLVEHGADLNNSNKKGQTPLMVCAMRQSCDLLQYLLQKGAAHDHTDTDGNTAIFYAAQSNSARSVQTLIQYNAVVNVRNTAAVSPLMISAFYNSSDVIQEIANYDDLDGFDNQGDTPLLFAVLSNAQEAAKVLINKGADINVQNDSGETALMISAGAKNKTVVAILLESFPCLDIEDKNGNTALFYAATTNASHIAGLLLEKNINVNHRNRKEETPLMRAAKSNAVGVIKFLIKHEANIEDKDINGDTALGHAVLSNSTGSAKYLLKKSANLRTVNNYGMTLLMLAAKANAAHIIEILQLTQCQVNMKNKQGKTAYDIALEFDSTAAIGKLEEYYQRFGLSLEIQNRKKNWNYSKTPESKEENEEKNRQKRNKSNQKKDALKIKHNYQKKTIPKQKGTEDLIREIIKQIDDEVADVKLVLGAYLGISATNMKEIIKQFLGKSQKQASHILTTWNAETTIAHDHKIQELRNALEFANKPGILNQISNLTQKASEDENKHTVGHSPLTPIPGPSFFETCAHPSEAWTNFGWSLERSSSSETDQEQSERMPDSTITFKVILEESNTRLRTLEDKTLKVIEDINLDTILNESAEKLDSKKSLLERTEDVNPDDDLADRTMMLKINEKMKTLLGNLDRDIPNCVRELLPSYEMEKILILTEDDKCPEFREFCKWINYPEDEMLEIALVQSSLADEYLANPKGATGTEVREYVEPGSVVFNIKAEHEHLLFEEGMDSFNAVEHKLYNHYKVPPWSIGCPAVEKETNETYLLTTCHCLGEGLSTGKINDYAFYSEYAKDENCSALEKICHDHLGYFGPMKHQHESSTFLAIDGLLLPVEHTFFKKDHVDMTFCKPNDPNQQTISMEFYLDPIQNLGTTRVYKHGAHTDFTEGVIEPTNPAGALQIQNRFCSGLFLVRPAPRKKTKMTTFATAGDSGSLVFGKNPATKAFVALGLVLKKPSDFQQKALMKQYDDSIYCIPISSITKYMQTHGKTLQFCNEIPSHLTPKVHYCTHFNFYELKNELISRRDFQRSAI